MELGAQAGAVGRVVAKAVAACVLWEVVQLHLFILKVHKMLLRAGSTDLVPRAAGCSEFRGWMCQGRS